MATIKSFTDLSQSKVLAEILSLKSADMWWLYVSSQGKYIAMMYEEPDPHYIARMESYGIKDAAIRCWSLAALLSVLPTLDDRNAILCKDIRYDKWHICYHSTATLSVIDTERYDNPVDACVEMIIRLHELKML